MFSSKVILAMEVLLCLETQDHNVRSHKRVGGDPLKLLGVHEQHRTTLRMVLHRLMECQYIVLGGTPPCYVALKNPSEITILHLIQLFHGDVCVGEAYDHYLTIGRENLENDPYRKIMRFEAKLHKKICQQLSGVSIATFGRVMFDELRLKRRKTTATRLLLRNQAIG